MVSFKKNSEAKNRMLSGIGVCSSTGATPVALSRFTFT
jgi:hypothetical protein